MSPKNAKKVFLAENDPDLAETLEEFLEKSGHRVVLKASTPEEAMKCIRRLEEMGVDVAIVDGNLSEWDTSGRDGARIVEEIKREPPSVYIIGNSSHSEIPGCDINRNKAEGFEPLIKALTDA